MSQREGVVIVKVTLKQALATVPASFSVASPARVAFDFPDTGNALGRNVQQVNQGDLRSVNIVQVGDRTRLVLNMNKLSSYEARVEGPVLYITLASVVMSADSTATPLISHFAAAKQQSGQSIRGVNFRRGKAEAVIRAALPFRSKCRDRYPEAGKESRRSLQKDRASGAIEPAHGCHRLCYPGDRGEHPGAG